MNRRTSTCILLFAVVTTISLSAQALRGQTPARRTQPTLGKEERARAREILATMKDAVQTIYYDPGNRGIDVNAHFAGAEAKLAEATSLSQLHLIGLGGRMLARLLQIEKRAVVVGDRTSGLTMQARMVQAGLRTVDGFIPYRAAISDGEP